MKKITVNLYEMEENCDYCGGSYANVVEIISKDFPHIETILGDPDCCRITHAILQDGVFHLFEQFNIIPKFDERMIPVIYKIGEENFFKVRNKECYAEYHLNKEDILLILNPSLELSEHDCSMEKMLISVFKEKGIIIVINNTLPIYD